MKILLVDAYDSFVYIIFQYIKSLGATVDVVRNDKLTFAEIEVRNYAGIILGPGPGHPSACGYVELINHFKGKIPIFGVCLGMQAIAVAFGGEVVKAQQVRHGKTSSVLHRNTDCFIGLANPVTVTRYHSLIAKSATLPQNELKVLARSIDDDYIMGLKHHDYNISGVQFHPESIGTENGLTIFSNFLNSI